MTIFRQVSPRIGSVMFGSLTRCLAVPSVVFCAALAASGAETRVSQVTKLEHLAVVLPQLDITQERWDCDALWTPSVDDAAAAERAISERLAEFAQWDSRINLKEKYIIQYYGVVLKERKWVVCQAVKASYFRNLARKTTTRQFARELGEALTSPIDVYDSPDHFDAMFDPSAKKLSESVGSLAEPSRERRTAPNQGAARSVQRNDELPATRERPNPQREPMKRGQKPHVVAPVRPVRHVARVGKFEQFGVLLPELETTRGKWQRCEALWTPGVDQAKAAEKAVLQRLRQLAKSDTVRNPDSADYVIQYYGVVLDKKKVVVCEVVDVAHLTTVALRDSPEAFAQTLEQVLTAPLGPDDPPQCLEALYDPSTESLVSRSQDSATAPPQR